MADSDKSQFGVIGMAVMGRNLAMNIRDRGTSVAVYNRNQDVMKAAIEAYLEKEEAVEAEKALIRARWDSFALTGETVSQSDMLDWARSLPEA